MNESDDVWSKVRPNMNADNDDLFINLRDIYKEGIPKKEFSDSQLKGAEKAVFYFIKDRWKRTCRKC